MLTIAPDAPSLYAARNLVLNLNEPNKLGDVSWVTPRKYVGIWWGMHLETQSWASGAKHGATTANALKLIDFAAKNKIAGMLVEGWNVGWDGDWFANGQEFSFTKPYPDFDLPRIAAYAKRKGVALIGHHETSANIAHYEAQMGAGFDYFRQHGIDAVKTGYVSDAGGVQARGPRRQDPLRMARRPGHGAPPRQGRRGGRQAAHRDQRARADQGQRAAPHLPQHGQPRRPARDGI